MWLLWVGIAALSATLIYQQTQPDHRITKRTFEFRTAATKSESEAHHQTKYPELADYRPEQLDAAWLWYHEKGADCLKPGAKLHIRHFVAGERVNPNNPLSTRYPHAMMQVYSDDQSDLSGSVTYTRHADNTATIASFVPAYWIEGPMGYDDGETMDTANMIAPKRTVSLHETKPAEVLKLVQRMV